MVSAASTQKPRSPHILKAIFGEVQGYQSALTCKLRLILPSVGGLALGKDLSFQAMGQGKWNS